MPIQASWRRDAVLDAAERLLVKTGTGFSMRDLAAEAGVSFATPFNQFGSKGAIVQALSARRIDLMQQRLAAAALPARVAPRVLAAVDLATGVMLESPAVNRAVMGALGAPGDAVGDTFARSGALWSAAIGTGDGLVASGRRMALRALPAQLALVFRGALSFWTAGEFDDAALAASARTAAAVVLLGFVDRAGRAELAPWLPGADS